MRKPRKQMKKRERFNFKRYLLWFTVAAGKERVLELLHSLSLSACLIFLLICFDASAKVLVQQQNKT